MEDVDKIYEHKILIVDDQVFNINALFSILEYGLKINVSKLCDKASSGKVALQIIEKSIL